MIIDIAILVIGLVTVTLGANWLTDGASSIAKQLGVTEFLIGMTIVAVGTSLPEMVVSVFASISGSSDLSAGNIIGSNICNIFLILGITSIIVPIPLTKNIIKVDLPLTLLVSILFALLALDSLFGKDYNNLSRIDGIVFLLLYIAFLYYMIKTSKDDYSESDNKTVMQLWKAITFTGLGLALLIFGAKLFVSGATGIAKALQISEAIIGITVVAIGTSLPELAASFVAAIKGRSGMAIGNILGSNIANILLIMGSSSLISPLHLNDISYIDFIVMILAPAILLLFPVVFRSMKINRFEGISLLAIYIAYTIQLIL